MKVGALWPLAIVGVLALTVGANVVMLWIARDPNALVVEPHYYEKAMHWDSTMALARRSAALGWRVDATLHGWTPARTPVVVALADSTGAPVSGAEVSADLLHNLAPAQVIALRFRETRPGRYETPAALPHAGLWELRLTAIRGADVFVADLRREAAPGGTP